MNYTDINAATIDKWVSEGWQWGQPISHDEYEAAKNGMQFSHTITEQIGGQLHAGFTLLDIYEDTNGTGRLHELNVPTFLAMLAQKT